MHSIDTYYDRNYFRSRLEARWAVFFNKAGIKYQYEPQGFKSDSGEMYLPDFYLPETYLRYGSNKGVYVEIKPDIFKENEIPARKWFADNLVLFTGTPDAHLWWDDNFKTALGNGYQQTMRDEKDRLWWDNCMKIWICDKCRASKIEFWEGNYNHCPIDGCKGGYNHKKLDKAALAANMARFEHKNKY